MNLYIICWESIYYIYYTYLIYLGYLFVDLVIYIYIYLHIYNIYDFYKGGARAAWRGRPIKAFQKKKKITAKKMGACRFY